jgi:hypothetical protein
MKRVTLAFLAVALLLMVPLSGNAQCKGFAKKVCKLELAPYIHDGNFHAAVLSEGEEAELYKTFYSDQQYRIAICGTETLPKIEFKVIDANKNVLYDNKKNNYATTWDFKLESSQQLKIYIKIPVTSTSADELINGCVSIMFGFKEK